MNRDTLRYGAIGLAIVAVGIAFVLYLTRGAHMRLEGTVQLVRVQAIDDRSCVVVADFRFVNPADYPFVVRDAELLLEDADGKILKGMAIGETDAQRLFQYYPLLGQKYNESLILRDRIEPGQKLDRMIATRFEFPAATAELRRRVIIRVEEVDGAIAEIKEQRLSQGPR